MIATVLRLSGRRVRTDFSSVASPVASRRTHQGLDYGAFEDVIGTMDATRSVNRSTVEIPWHFLQTDLRTSRVSAKPSFNLSNSSGISVP
jgi:hypothetical protein